MTRYGSRTRSPAATKRGTCGPLSTGRICSSTSKLTMFSAPSPAVMRGIFIAMAKPGLRSACAYSTA